ncbi:ChaB family protein [Cellulomonas sp. P22]|uniref:ChaB family protein n=1 Tax=Cellulomonas sp. P22 TaxID=3373189 RepID=UPI0037B2BCA9
MPMIGKKGKVHKSELPSTVARSGRKARETFAKAHDAAAEQYGEGERALGAAYSTLEHTHEKVGKHWERKHDEKKGRGHRGPDAPRRTSTDVRLDASATKAHLYEAAKGLGIPRRSTMSKSELVTAIQQENRRRSRAARA